MQQRVHDVVVYAKFTVLKARYGMSGAGFDAYLSIIVDMLPKKNKVIANT